MEQLVSIMMPVYNGLPLIKASIKSILDQTYKNWECLIVDDGSNDGTAEYLDTLEDIRFKVYHFKNNKGRPAARQKALDEAKGYYLAMLDAEDFYHPCKLEKQIKVFQQNCDVALVSTNMCSFGTKTKLLRKRGTNKFSKITFNRQVYPNHAPSMLILEKAKKFRYNPDLTTGQDTDFLERYLVGEKFILLSDILYYYSEFDSVTKIKIRRTYYLHIKEYYKQHIYSKSFINLLKYIYALIVFPFLNIKSIIAKRGKELTDIEKNEYDVLYNRYV